MALALSVHRQMLKVMESRDRGVEVRKRNDRGGRSLWQGKAPAIMTEPFFGSNPEEWRRANARIDQLAEAIYRGARDAF
jgi:N-acetylmuramoyl-L-alanine amidase